MPKRRTPEQERQKRARRVERARIAGNCTQCCGASKIKPEPGEASCTACKQRAHQRYVNKAEAWKEMQTYEQELRHAELVPRRGGYF